MWYKEIFGEVYPRIDTGHATKEEVEFLEKYLGLTPEYCGLDLCCGYGRHVIPLKKKGYNVYGYDLSRKLLDMINSAYPGISIQGDMRTLPFCETFDFVLNMYTSFGYFKKEHENFQVLSEVHRLLRPGGKFVLEVANRDYVCRYFTENEWYEANGCIVLERKKFDIKTGHSYIDMTVMDKEGYNAAENSLEKAGDGKRYVRKKYSHDIRLYSYTEIKMLLEAAGYTVMGVFGSFKGEELTWDHPRMIIFADKGIIPTGDNV